MKKLLLITCLMVSTISFLSAQDNGTIYVVFTSTRNDSTDDSAGVWHSTRDSFNPNFYKSPTHTYTIWDRSKNYFFKFDYVNGKNKPDNPIISKPVSFLATVEYIDWDVIGPTLTKAQAEAKYQEIISHAKIYFIDRNDTKDGMMKMVPVVKHRPAFS